MAGGGMGAMPTGMAQQGTSTTSGQPGMAGMGGQMTRFGGAPAPYMGDTFAPQGNRQPVNMSQIMGMLNGINPQGAQMPQQPPQQMIQQPQFQPQYQQIAQQQMPQQAMPQSSMPTANIQQMNQMLRGLPANNQSVQPQQVAQSAAQMPTQTQPQGIASLPRKSGFLNRITKRIR